MSRTLRLAITWAIAVALAAPALVWGIEPEVPGPPTAAFEIEPEAPVAGERVVLDGSASTGEGLTFEWDVDGDGLFEARPQPVEKVLSTVLPDAGPVRVSLRVTDDQGVQASSHRDIDVRVAPPAPGRDPEVEPRDDAVAPAAPDQATVTPDEPSAPRDRARPERGSKPPRRLAPLGADQRLLARAAADGSVTIQNFAFAPASVTVNAGDTVTWNNRDSTGHSATAGDGTFDTGILSQGESGSYRFEEAGTYSYFCTPHPGMKGSVRVVAAGSGGGGSGGGGSGERGGSGGSGVDLGPDETSDPTDSGRGLPRTGGHPLPIAGLGAALLWLGLSLVGYRRAGQTLADLGLGGSG